ncbi:unnamed protein product [Polarella glacialis]|uniref:Uncharacterized protein n=1 Tax=Polarella glacialis TaxID=89957 RepID=A0A813IWR9_POLGL|nr:unnamed protein product [Polarella glacialis]
MPRLHNSDMLILLQFISGIKMRILSIPVFGRNPGCLSAGMKMLRQRPSHAAYMVPLFLLLQQRRRLHGAVVHATTAYSPRRLFVLGEVRAGDLLFVHMPLNTTQPFGSAIQATGNATIDWLKAHGRSVGAHDTAVHVAMVVDDAAAFVVEAVRSGVRTRAIADFWADFPEGSRFFHGVLSPHVPREKSAAAVAFALQKVGLPYAESFELPSPSHERYYCSSLVDYAYRSALQQRLVFTEVGFPLMFVPKSFWEDYYRKMNQSLPHASGSNPTLLLHSSRVRYSQLVEDGSIFAPAG